MFNSLSIIVNSLFFIDEFLLSLATVLNKQQGDPLFAGYVLEAIRELNIL